MSLVQDTKDIQAALDRLKLKAERQQRLYFNIISGIVRLCQEYRIAGDYAVSDQIREVLSDNGIRIIQGTKKYGRYENIPANMRNETVDDRWELTQLEDIRSI